MKSKLFSILVLAAMAALALAACSSGPQPLDVTIKGEDIKYSPTEIRVKVNQQVNLTFQNAGALEHSLIIEAFGVKLEKVQAGQSATASFTPAAAGEYEFHCDVAGHTEAGMVGKIIVEP